MYIDQLIESPVAWMSRRNTGIVISSRVRLARDLKGMAFPGWAGENESLQVCTDLKNVFEKLPSFTGLSFFEMDQLADIDKQVLIERNLISSALAKKGKGSALVVAEDQHIAVMINEEDHLRLQAVKAGLHLNSIWKTIDSVDSEIESSLDFAFSPALGYLTACPSNVGTGLRASVMVHLLGMKLTGELDAALNGLSSIGLAIRGILGEGTKSFGSIFQVSNQSTLGMSEGDIIKKLDKLVRELVVHEENARARLMEQKQSYLFDHVARAFGILTHARLLSSGESIDMLSALRLGVDLGLVKNLTVSKISEIMLVTQPGHLQKEAGKVMSEEERDYLRATVVRDGVRKVKLADEAVTLSGSVMLEK
ncbi:MAG: protein arginine kinase [Kiritimatiellae bacterium]|nr:protein arginine kinase [Kiritimatiellia bacterium]